ncbi:MAG TPA: hypothetical protein DHV62_05535 [Elusimicrobia bacterium]|nr:hypothetical protein [Elusimicrobiota bacterium]
MENIILQPNPFSPKVKNIQFKYFLNSDSAQKVYVTIKIYNIIGDLVKTIRENYPLDIGNNTDEWNGLNNDGELCLNGRYVVEFIVEEGGKSKRILKPIVLVK